MQRQQIIGGLLGAILCESLLGNRHGEKKITPQEFRDNAMRQRQQAQTAIGIELKLLDQGARGDKDIVSVHTGIAEIKGEISYHTIATYADKTMRDVSVVYIDSRDSGREKEYNVNGLHAATAVQEQIEHQLEHEVLASLKAEATAQREAAEEGKTTTDAGLDRRDDK